MKKTKDTKIPHQAYGFTLIELVVTMALAGIVLGLAIPNLRDAVQNNKLTSNSNQLASALKFARSEALKRRSSITVCGLNAGQTACSSSTNWGTNGYGALDSSSNVLKIWGEPAMYDDLTMTSSSASLVYASSGMLNGGSSIGVRVAFTDVTDNRCIVISSTGRTNIQKIASSGVSCP